MVGDINLHAAEASSTESKAVSRAEDFQSWSIHVDVRSPSSVETAIQETVKTFGRIDYCVNCAGVRIMQSDY